MLQNRKLQVLILALIITGAWWAKKSPESKLEGMPTVVKNTLTPTEPKVAATSASASTTSAATVEATANQAPTRLTAQVNAIADSLSNPDQVLSAELLDVSKITPQERRQLRIAVTNRNEQGTVRRASLFLLKRMGYVAIQELGEIASAPIPQLPASKDPHSTAVMEAKFEKGLRISSLEALDQMVTHGKEVLPLLQNALAAQSDQDLILLTRISIYGIISGKPGKLSRAMDAMINEKISKKGS